MKLELGDGEEVITQSIRDNYPINQRHWPSQHLDLLNLPRPIFRHWYTSLSLPPCLLILPSTLNISIKIGCSSSFETFPQIININNLLSSPHIELSFRSSPNINRKSSDTFYLSLPGIIFPSRLIWSEVNSSPWRLICLSSSGMLSNKRRYSWLQICWSGWPVWLWSCFNTNYN